MGYVSTIVGWPYEGFIAPATEDVVYMLRDKSKYTELGRPSDSKVNRAWKGPQ